MLSDTWLTMSCADDNVCEFTSHCANEVEIEYFNELGIPPLSGINHGLTYDCVKVKIPMQRRSLIVLHGPGRHKWKHAIER